MPVDEAGDTVFEDANSAGPLDAPESTDAQLMQCSSLARPLAPLLLSLIHI